MFKKKCVKRNLFILLVVSLYAHVVGVQALESKESAHDFKNALINTKSHVSALDAYIVEKGLKNCADKPNKDMQGQLTSLKTYLDVANEKLDNIMAIEKYPHDSVPGLLDMFTRRVISFSIHSKKILKSDSVCAIDEKELNKLTEVVKKDIEALLMAYIAILPESPSPEPKG